MSHGFAGRYKPVLFLGIALGSLVVAPEMAHAAAAKALGDGKKAVAAASANVSNNNPEEAQIAATFDPVMTPDDPAGTPLAIQDFQMNVSYNSNDLTLVDIFGIDGFEVSSFDESTPGLITDIDGQFVDGEEVGLTPDFKGDGAVKPDTGLPINTNTGDQNFFTAVFELNDGASPDTPETFTFFAGSDSFIDATDPNDPDQNVYTAGPDDITSASTTGSVDAGQLPSPGGNGAGAVPLPASAWTGGLMMVLLAAGIKFCSPRRANQG